MFIFMNRIWGMWKYTADLQFYIVLYRLQLVSYMYMHIKLSLVFLLLFVVYVIFKAKLESRDPCPHTSHLQTSIFPFEQWVRCAIYKQLHTSKVSLGENEQRVWVIISLNWSQLEPKLFSEVLNFASDVGDSELSLLTSIH